MLKNYNITDILFSGLKGKLTFNITDAQINEIMQSFPSKLNWIKSISSQEGHIDVIIGGLVSVTLRVALGKINITRNKLVLQLTIMNGGLITKVLDKYLSKYDLITLKGNDKIEVDLSKKWNAITKKLPHVIVEKIDCVKVDVVPILGQVELKINIQ